MKIKLLALIFLSIATSVCCPMQEVNFLLQCFDGDQTIVMTPPVIAKFSTLQHMYQEISSNDNTLNNEQENSIITLSLKNFNFATKKFVRDYFGVAQQSPLTQQEFNKLAGPNLKNIGSLMRCYTLSHYLDEKILKEQVIVGINNYLDTYSVRSSLALLKSIEDFFKLYAVGDGYKDFLNFFVQINFTNSPLKENLISSIKNKNSTINMVDLYSIIQWLNISDNKKEKFTTYPYDILLGYLEKLPLSIKELIQGTSSIALLSVEYLKFHKQPIKFNFTSLSDSQGASMNLDYDIARTIPALNVEVPSNDENNVTSVVLPFNCPTYLIVQCLELMLLNYSPTEFEQRIITYTQANPILKDAEINVHSRVINKLAFYLVIADYFGLEALKQELEKYIQQYLMSFDRTSIQFLKNFLDLYTTIYVQIGNQSGLPDRKLLDNFIEMLPEYLLKNSIIKDNNLFKNSTQPIHSIKVSSNLAYLAYLNEHKNSIYLKSFVNGTLINNFSSRPYETANSFVGVSVIEEFIFSPDNSTIACSEQHGEIYIASLAQSVLHKISGYETRKPQSIAFDPTSQYLLAVYAQGQYSIYNVVSKTVTHFAISLKDTNEEVELVKGFFSPQGKYIVLLDNKCNAYIIENLTKKLICVIETDSSQVFAFNPTNEAIVAYQSTDDSITIENIITNKVISCFNFDNKEENNLLSLSFNKKATALIIASDIGDLWIHSLKTDLQGNVSIQPVINFYLDDKDDKYTEFYEIFINDADQIIAVSQSLTFCMTDLELLLSTEQNNFLGLALLFAKNVSTNQDPAYKAIVKEIEQLLHAQEQQEDYNRPAKRARRD